MRACLMKFRDPLLSAILVQGALLGVGGCQQGQSAVTTTSTLNMTLKASALSVPEGSTITLNWNAPHAAGCTAAGSWSGMRAASGSESIGPMLTPAVFSLRCFSAEATADAALRVVTRSGTPRSFFPLRASQNQRHLVDAQGVPFLIHGDSAWSLIAELKREQVIRYLDDRQARGFNTLLVNLLEHKFATRAPRNAYGDAPFLNAGDFSKPNPAYFSHAEWVLRQAADRGFLVLLVPAYLGFNGGDEGWHQELNEAPPGSLSGFGNYLGQQFQSLPNIIWAYGGDYTPPNRRLVQDIAAGIRAFDTHSLGTAHAAPETSAREIWGNESWLNVGTVYTYEHVVGKSTIEYQRAPIMPFFLLESSYEAEQTHDLNLVRAHAYQAMLSGAAGQIFGNNPIWHFSGPGLNPPDATWEASLNSPGNQSMQHLLALFSSHDWWRLEPDLNSQLLKDATGSEGERAVAAMANDRSFAIIYLPAGRPIKVDLKRLACRMCEASWYNPSTGAYGPTIPLSAADAGVMEFRPPDGNSKGATDWVLVLNAEATPQAPTKPAGITE